MTTIQATGNTTKSHVSYNAKDTFLEITGGSGNTNDNEVHLMMQSNDGEFAQGWFRIADLLAAIKSEGDWS